MLGGRVSTMLRVALVVFGALVFGVLWSVHEGHRADALGLAVSAPLSSPVAAPATLHAGAAPATPAMPTPHPIASPVALVPRVAPVVAPVTRVLAPVTDRVSRAVSQVVPPVARAVSQVVARAVSQVVAPFAPVTAPVTQLVLGTVGSVGPPALPPLVLPIPNSDRSRSSAVTAASTAIGPLWIAKRAPAIVASSVATAGDVVSSAFRALRTSSPMGLPFGPVPLPLPPVHQLPGSGNQFPGGLAVLTAAAAVASLFGRRLRFATAARPQLLLASLIERPG